MQQGATASQLTSDLFRRDSAVYPTRAPVWLVVVGGLVPVASPAEKHVEEATRASGLGHGLADRECIRVLLQSGRLPQVELGAVPRETIAKVQPVANGVAKVDTEVYVESLLACT